LGVAFVERLNEVEETVLLGLEAGQAAVAVERFSRHLPLSEAERRALESIERRIDEQLGPDQRPSTLGPVALLTREASFDPLAGDVMELSPEAQEELRELHDHLERVLAGDHSAFRTGTLEAIRDSLSQVSAKARTKVSLMSEPGVPGVPWISAASSLF
jgi:hypothetical protein